MERGKRKENTSEPEKRKENTSEPEERKENTSEPGIDSYDLWAFSSA
ncbi:MAG: hypothetical protein J6W05_01100 [Prevotella sp.]|nr:hypothetical protein [Prevotella sp.]